MINLHVYSWIINDQQPFNVVENKEFKSLLFVLDPRYKLPTRQTVSQHIGEIFNKQKLIICNILQFIVVINLKTSQLDISDYIIIGL